MKLKHAQGRVVDVPENLVDSYTSLGWEPLDGESGETSGTPTAPSKSWKVDELTAYATEHGIDLGGATKKADILAVIEAAAKAADGDSGEASGDGTGDDGTAQAHSDSAPESAE